MLMRDSVSMADFLVLLH